MYAALVPTLCVPQKSVLSARNRSCADYYNARTRATTWYKPRKDQPPPPPPSRPSDAERKGRNRLPRRPSGRDSSPSMEVPNHTSQGHAVSEAIAAMQTKKKMVETVQIECAIAPRHGHQGLQSVSL